LLELREAFERMSTRTCYRPALMWDVKGKLLAPLLFFLLLVIVHSHVLVSIQTLLPNLFLYLLLPPSSFLLFSPLLSSPLPHPASVQKTVAYEGMLLQHAHAWLKSDPDVVLAAVTNNGAALRYASLALRGNREICLAAVTSCGFALQFCTYRGDRDLVHSAIVQDSMSIIFADHSFMEDEELLNIAGGDTKYVDLVALALQRDGNALRFVRDDLLEIRELCLVAVTSPVSSHGKSDGTALRFCTKEMRADREFVLAALSFDGLGLRHASIELKNNREVILAALDNDGAALQYVGGGFGGILQVQVEGVVEEVVVKAVDLTVEEKEAAAAAAMLAVDPTAAEKEEKERQVRKEHASAQYNLGVAYYGGGRGRGSGSGKNDGSSTYGGVKRSLLKARHWWVLAASCGHPVARYNLGLMYLNGLGVPSVSLKRAEEYMALAHEAGHVDAHGMLERIQQRRREVEMPTLRATEESEGVGEGEGGADERGGGTTSDTRTPPPSPRRLPPILGTHGVACHPLRNDRTLVLVAIESNPMALEFASVPMRSDVEICVHACSLNGRALQFVHSLQWSDREKKRVLDAAVRNCGPGAVLSNDVLPDMMVLQREDVEALLWR